MYSTLVFPLVAVVLFLFKLVLTTTYLGDAVVYRKGGACTESMEDVNLIHRSLLPLPSSEDCASSILLDNVTG
jgi:hypothetical protein